MSVGTTGFISTHHVHIEGVWSTHALPQRRGFSRVTHLLILRKSFERNVIVAVQLAATPSASFWDLCRSSGTQETLLEFYSSFPLLFRTPRLFSYLGFSMVSVARPIAIATSLLPQKDACLIQEPGQSRLRTSGSLQGCRHYRLRGRVVLLATLAIRSASFTVRSCLCCAHRPSRHVDVVEAIPFEEIALAAASGNEGRHVKGTIVYRGNPALSITLRQAKGSMT